MRFVPRTPQPPASLSARNRAGLSELERARQHHADAQARAKSFEFAVYKSAEVKDTLEKLFHGKCAYCETNFSVSAPSDVEHYRPKARVSEAPDHPGYWWIAMSWDNLLPSCIDCNRKRKQLYVPWDGTLASMSRRALASESLGKLDSFPLAAGAARLQPESSRFDDEQALLLDPTRDQPEQFLAYHFEGAEPLAVVVPVGDERQRERGAVSIQTYGLNRLALVQERTRLLRRLELLADAVVELAAVADELSRPDVVDRLRGTGAATAARRLRQLRDRLLDEMKSMAKPDAPYSAMAKAYLRTFADRLRP